MNRKELDGLLGMYEMEMAVEVMLQKSEQAGVPFGALIMTPEEFKGGALVGFCQLLYRELMEPGYPNGEFKVTKKLTEIMRDRRACFKDLTDPPTWDEWFERRFVFPPGAEAPK